MTPITLDPVPRATDSGAADDRAGEPTTRGRQPASVAPATGADGGLVTAPILTVRDYDARSVLLPDNLLREARRQKRVAVGSVPPVCVLDPDGDLAAHLRADYGATPSPVWPCFHTQLWEAQFGSLRLGVVDRAVGAAFAVLVAEQLFASGCELLISLASAGQIVDASDPPYFVVIERALRDEGTSYHYLPPASWVAAAADLVELGATALAACGQTVHRGPSWTTDAPFRETPQAIEACLAQGILAVEMEAAALYAFALARARPVLCLAYVTNRLGRVEGDFEKGETNGAGAALGVIAAAAAAWLGNRRPATGAAEPVARGRRPHGDGHADRQVPPFHPR